MPHKGINIDKQDTLKNIGGAFLEEKEHLFNLRFFTTESMTPLVKHSGCVLEIRKKQKGNNFEVFFTPTGNGSISFTFYENEAKITWEKLENSEYPIPLDHLNSNDFESYVVTDFEGRKALLWIGGPVAIVDEVLSDEEAKNHIEGTKAINNILSFTQEGKLDLDDYDQYKKDIEKLSSLKNISVEELEHFVWVFANKGEIVYH